MENQVCQMENFGSRNKYSRKGNSNMECGRYAQGSI